MLLLIFVIITIFSAIRFGVGYDYYSYLDIATNLYSSEVNERIELIPRLMLEISYFSVPFLFFVLSSIFISFFYYKGIKNIGCNYLESTIFYLCFPFLFMDQLGIVRQGMASSVVFYAISLGNNKVLQRFLLIVIAFFCHSSAIAAVLLLFPWHKITARRLWVVFLSSFFIGTVLVRIILELLTRISIEGVNNRAEGYLSEESNGEGRLLQYLIYMIAVLCLSNYKRIVSYSKKNSYYIGLVVLGASFFALFSFNDAVAKRLCMFFFSATIMVVPYLVRSMRISIRIYYTLCIVLFSLLIFVGRTNQRDQDPPGYSATYPYRTLFDELINY